MKSKIASLFAILLIALAVFGFSHAWWAETLTIQGSVTTGELDVEFRNVYCTPDPYISCTAIPSDTDGDGDYDKIDVTVINGYPSGKCVVAFDIYNSGSIPAKVKSITIAEPPEVDATLQGITEGDEISVGTSKACTLTLHITENAQETQTYTVSVTIEFKQFNAP
ncbi:MAG: hypothetical protein QXP36_02610 [Conexivisphaerales archaeon]